jgi:hypothetical protein
LPSVSVVGTSSQGNSANIRNTMLMRGRGRVTVRPL